MSAVSEYLDAVQARIARSTTGPWETRINDLTDEVTVVHDSEAVLQVAWIDGDYRHTWAMPDAEFIANARVDVPRLLAAIRAVQAAIAGVELDVRFRSDWEDGRAALAQEIRVAITDALEGEQ